MTQITNIRNGREEIILEPMVIKRMIKEFDGQLCAYKFNGT
jgi:hypothetical protein